MRPGVPTVWVSLNRPGDNKDTRGARLPSLSKKAATKVTHLRSGLQQGPVSPLAAETHLRDLERGEAPKGRVFHVTLDLCRPRKPASMGVPSCRQPAPTAGTEPNCRLAPPHPRQHPTASGSSGGSRPGPLPSPPLSSPLLPICRPQPCPGCRDGPRPEHSEGRGPWDSSPSLCRRPPCRSPNCSRGPPPACAS